MGANDRLGARRFALPPDPQDGRRIGAYAILSTAGRGGMGVVYRAEHVHLRRRVALKVLPEELAASEDFRERFLRESRTAAAIDHPSIVTVYDAGEADGYLYLAMRWIDGLDLAGVLRRDGPLAPERALGLLGQVADALDAAHATGLVHRDVKPANVMVDGERAYLTDFGLTKQVADVTALTKTGQFVGTVDYMAPEQVKAGNVDGRADQYSLGAVLHECVTGGRPYDRDSDLAVLYAHLEEPPPRPCELNPRLPAGFDAVVAKAMAKERAERYASCCELVEAARAALAEPPAEPGRDETRRAARPAARPTAPQRATAATAPLAAETATPASEPPTRAPVTTHRGRRVPLPLVLGVLAALVLVALAVLVLGGGGDDGGVAEGGGNGSDDGGGPPRVGRPIDVGTRPFGVALAGGSPWVASFNDDTLTRAAPASEQTTVDVGDGPFGVATGAGSVWVGNVRDGTVSRVDPESGGVQATIPVGTSPFYVAARRDAVWVSNGGDGTVMRIDPDSDSVAEDVPVGDDPRGIAIDRDAAWVSVSAQDEVVRVEGGEVTERVAVGDDPNGLTIGAGAVWVVNEGDDSVSRVPLDGGGTDTIPVGREPFDVAFGAGSVWVANAMDDTVVRLDPRTRERVGRPIEVGAQPVGITASDAEVWVTANDDGTVTPIRP